VITQLLSERYDILDALEAAADNAAEQARQDAAQGFTSESNDLHATAVRLQTLAAKLSKAVDEDWQIEAVSDPWRDLPVPSGPFAEAAHAIAEQRPAERHER